jgi:hypothetical protein
MLARLLPEMHRLIFSFPLMIGRGRNALSITDMISPRTSFSLSQLAAPMFYHLTPLPFVILLPNAIPLYPRQQTKFALLLAELSPLVQPAHLTLPFAGHSLPRFKGGRLLLLKQCLFLSRKPALKMPIQL